MAYADDGLVVHNFQASVALIVSDVTMIVSKGLLHTTLRVVGFGTLSWMLMSD